MFFIDKKEMHAHAREYARTYQEAIPFPHVVLDNLFPDEVLENILKEFPQNTEEWNTYSDTKQDKKFSCEDVDRMGPHTRQFLYECNSSLFIGFLELLTGITGLIPDPHYRGGGMHQTIHGGHLGIHADFNIYKRLGLYRRINMIIYLNKDWNESYGGALELWNHDMTVCEKSIPPVFNKTVIFNTDAHSYHGHPDPLNTPEDVSRKSLALYYYTSYRSESIAKKAHTTIFKKRPGKDKTFTSNTRWGRLKARIQKMF